MSDAVLWGEEESPEGACTWRADLLEAFILCFDEVIRQLAPGLTRVLSAHNNSRMNANGRSLRGSRSTSVLKS